MLSIVSGLKPPLAAYPSGKSASKNSLTFSTVSRPTNGEIAPGIIVAKPSLPKSNNPFAPAIKPLPMSSGPKAVPLLSCNVPPPNSPKNLIAPGSSTLINCVSALSTFSPVSISGELNIRYIKAPFPLPSCMSFIPCEKSITRPSLSLISFGPNFFSGCSSPSTVMSVSINPCKSSEKSTTSGVAAGLSVSPCCA